MGPAAEGVRVHTGTGESEASVGTGQNGAGCGLQAEPVEQDRVHTGLEQEGGGLSKACGPHWNVHVPQSVTRSPTGSISR